MGTAARVARWSLLIATVALALVCASVVWRGYDMYRDALAEHSIDEVVGTLRGQEAYTPIEELPQRYLDAVVAVEDHRFYEHGGIDPIAIARAVVNDVRTMSLAEGGSTITQQLAKNLFFTQDKRFARKVAEVFMAHDLERAFSKREILELYVNSSYFGDGFTGIGQACWGYLGHAPAAMDDGECALMAGIPNAPGLFSTDPEAARARQRIVVGQMRKYGYDPGTAALAAAE